MANTTILQNDVCYRFMSNPRSRALKAILKEITKCAGCSAKPRKDCCFYKEVDNRITEQRSFVISPKPHRLLEVKPYEHSAHVTPMFPPPPVTLTLEMIAECLIASAYILVPQLERHLVLRQECSSSIYRTPEMNGERVICDRCRMSLLCGVKLCKKCGLEVCDRCLQDDLIQKRCCASKDPSHNHDFALLEFFQPDELENALKVLKHIKPRESHPCPPNADIIRVKLSDGAGLPAYSALYRALATGVPMVVSGIDPGDSNLTPEYFIHRHGEEMVTVMNTATLVERTIALEEFMRRFSVDGVQLISEKLKDWPPTKHFAEIFPDMFKIFEEVLVGHILTSSTGALNLETSMPKGSCPPDTGPKAYLAHRAVGGATTRLHCDMTDAVNIMFYAEPGSNGSESGALWTMISRDDMALAESLLRDWKKDEFKGHPIHSQDISLTPADVARLREHGVNVWTFVQKPGEAVFIPAGVGHQVTNLSSCIKIAVDFVTPCNVIHSRKIGEELRQHRLETYENEAEDVLQLGPMCWWYFLRSQTEDYRCARSDPHSNPWECDYSAAPRYLQVPIRTGAGAEGRADDESTYVESTSGPEMNAVVFEGLSLGPAPVSLATEQTPSSSLLLGSSLPIVPLKRSNEAVVGDHPTVLRHKRAKKRRGALLSQSPNRRLSCPIGAPGDCKRPTDLFDRQGLLDHLEQSHRKYVTFRHQGHSMHHLSELRQEIHSKYPDDDQAYINYLKESVLSWVSSSQT